MDLEFIRKYIVRNPYTGGYVLDVVALEKDPSLLALLRKAWAEGYDGGLDDGISDCTVEQAHRNPFEL